jgi:hypothetical protein
MQQIAMRWLVYRLTKSTLLLGVVGFASDIPVFFLVPFAGVLADKFKRRRILAITQGLAALQAFVLAVLVITDQAGSGMSCCSARYWASSTPSTFPPARPSCGGGREEGGFRQRHRAELVHLQCALLIGPVIAGVLIAFFGEGLCLF